MSEHVYKAIEVTGSSHTGLSEAIGVAIAKASETIRNIDWFEVVSIRGHVAEGAVEHFQVTVKVGFRLE
jgi:flavin-binding protein dodecin